MKAVGFVNSAAIILLRCAHQGLARCAPFLDQRNGAVAADRNSRSISANLWHSQSGRQHKSGCLTLIIWLGEFQRLIFKSIKRTNTERSIIELGGNVRCGKNNLVAHLCALRLFHDELLEVLTTLRFHAFVFDVVVSDEFWIPEKRKIKRRKKDCKVDRGFQVCN